MPSEYPLPNRTVDPYSLSNDEFGFSVYTFVVFATDAQQAAVRSIRDQVKVRRSMLPAHVTVKGPVCDINDLAELQAAVDQTVRRLAPITVQFGERHDRTLDNGEQTGVVSIQVSDSLADAHRALLEAVDPISTNAYRLDSLGTFHPHLTVYHEPEPELAELGSRLLDKLEVGDSFQASKVALMGHVGRPFRGEWRMISEHALAGVWP